MTRAAAVVAGVLLLAPLQSCTPGYTTRATAVAGCTGCGTNAGAWTVRDDGVVCASGCCVDGGTAASETGFTYDWNGEVSGGVV